MAHSAPKLLNAREVCQMLGISISTLRRMVRQGQFSEPLKPSPGTSRWPRQVVNDYIEELQRRDGPPRVEPKTAHPTGINDRTGPKEEKEDPVADRH